MLDFSWFIETLFTEKNVHHACSYPQRSSYMGDTLFCMSSSESIRKSKNGMYRCSQIDEYFRECKLISICYPMKRLLDIPITCQSPCQRFHQKANRDEAFNKKNRINSTKELITGIIVKSQFLRIWLFLDEVSTMEDSSNETVTSCKSSLKTIKVSV